MRPEYIEGVDAVRWGWSLWLALLAPAGLVWLSASLWFFASLRKPVWLIPTIASITVSTAMILFWLLLVAHSNRVQSTKGRLMVTAAEESDWAADTGSTFAPFTAIPVSLVYCTSNALLAHDITFTVAWLWRARAVRHVNAT